MANYNFNNNSNQKYILGKIGNQEILREDINIFLNTTKDKEWTSNNIYKAASCVNVKTKFSNSHDINYNNNIVSKYDIRLVEDLISYNNDDKLKSYITYIADQEEKNIKTIDKISNNKEKISKFISNINFNNSSSSTIKNDIIYSLKNNWKKVILNNNELCSILLPYKGYINSTLNNYNS